MVWLAAKGNPHLRFGVLAFVRSSFSLENIQLIVLDEGNPQNYQTLEETNQKMPASQMACDIALNSRHLIIPSFWWHPFVLQSPDHYCCD
jgi:hypothetical protein